MAEKKKLSKNRIRGIVVACVSRHINFIDFFIFDYLSQTAAMFGVHVCADKIIDYVYVGHNKRKGRIQRFAWKSTVRRSKEQRVRGNLAGICGDGFSEDNRLRLCRICSELLKFSLRWSYFRCRRQSAYFYRREVLWPYSRHNPRTILMYNKLV